MHLASVPVARRCVGYPILQRGLDCVVGRGLAVAARTATLATTVHTGRRRAPPCVVVHGRRRGRVMLLPAPTAMSKNFFNG